MTIKTTLTNRFYKETYVSEIINFIHNYLTKNSNKFTFKYEMTSEILGFQDNSHFSVDDLNEWMISKSKRLHADERSIDEFKDDMYYTLQDYLDEHSVIIRILVVDDEILGEQTIMCLYPINSMYFSTKIIIVL